MTSKYRVSFDLNIEGISPDDVTENGVKAAIERLLTSARAHEKTKLHGIRTSSNLSQDEKAVAMADCLRGIMASLMAQANLSVESLLDDTHIETKQPFEHEYELDPS
jgi:hypothetical protein